MRMIHKYNLASTGSPSNRTRADDVYEKIKNEISEFRLIPGDHFTESEISKRFNVSRTPVRQALFRLQSEGYVQVQFRAGWRVQPFDFDIFEQLYDLRMVLEVAAVRRLCDQDRRVDLARLSSLQQIWLVPASERCTDGLQVASWDEQFHTTLVEASGNNEMARMHKDVTARIRIIRRLDFTKTDRITTTYTEHSEILREILRGKSEEAILLLCAHIEASQKEVQKITLHQIQLARKQGLGLVET